jgi:hypothetical protein
MISELGPLIDKQRRHASMDALRLVAIKKRPIRDEGLSWSNADFAAISGVSAVTLSIAGSAPTKGGLHAAVKEV